ncbi:MAG TPA: acylphosphatase [Thermogutta sp.]|nr:acylphosphatase [Thermogutta sp.]
MITLFATVRQYCGTGRINVEQREVYFSGMVQGVGFRYTAQRIASRYQVTGYVRNLPDGRVHLVAEGDPRELDQFIAEICQQMEGYIKSVDTRRLPATGQFARFFIKH